MKGVVPKDVMSKRNGLRFIPVFSLNMRVHDLPKTAGAAAAGAGQASGLSGLVWTIHLRPGPRNRQKKQPRLRSASEDAPPTQQAARPLLCRDRIALIKA